MWFIRTRCKDLEVSLFILNDNKNTALYKFGNQNDANTSTSVIAIAEKIIIPLDENIANRHGINDGDVVSLVEEGIGRITLIFKDTKNRVGKLPSNQPTIEGGYPT